jgi:high affinity sulfate transporter 1
LRTYQRGWLRYDLIAGVVVATILVPQGLAYAELAGLPPVTGLYTTIACLIAYAIMGPSRVLVLGPDSSVSPLIFAAIIPLLAGGDPGRAIALAGMLAIMVGLIEIGLGLGKLGFIADLLSKEVQIGYMNGLAIVIIIGQLPKLCGFSVDADGTIQEAQAFIAEVGEQLNPYSLALGLTALVVLLGLPRLTKRVPAVLVAVAGAAVATVALDLVAHGVATIGTLPTGIPLPSFPWTDVSDLVPLMAAAVGITLVSLTDTIANSTAFAARRGDEVNPNQEMIGVGTANVATGFFQGFAISTSSSRTAVAESSGAKSQLTGLVGAALVAVLLIFLPGLLTNVPSPALAAVVIMAAISLADLRGLRKFWRVRKSALALSVVTAAGVVIFGVLEGIVVALVVSILLFFRRSWWPHGAVLGYVPELDGWHDVEAHQGALGVPGVVVFRWEAPLFFANADLFRQRVRAIVRQQHPVWVVLQCEAITDIDVTAADMLERLDLELNAQGVHMAFVELRDRLHSLLLVYGLFETLDRDHFYPNLSQALADIAGSPEDVG